MSGTGLHGSSRKLIWREEKAQFIEQWRNLSFNANFIDSQLGKPSCEKKREWFSLLSLHIILELGQFAYLKARVKFHAHSGDIYDIYTSDNNNTLELRFIIHSGYIQNTFRKFQKQFYTFILPSGNFQIKFMWFPSFISTRLISFASKPIKLLLRLRLCLRSFDLTLSLP